MGRGPHSGCRVTPKAEGIGPHTYTYTYKHTSHPGHKSPHPPRHTGQDGVCIPPTNAQRIFFPSPISLIPKKPQEPGLKVKDGGGSPKLTQTPSGAFTHPLCPLPISSLEAKFCGQLHTCRSPLLDGSIEVVDPDPPDYFSRADRSRSFHPTLFHLNFTLFETFLQKRCYQPILQRVTLDKLFYSPVSWDGPSGCPVLSSSDFWFIPILSERKS